MFSPYWVKVTDILGANVVHDEPLIEITGLTSFSDFGISGDGGGALPVELSSFTAEATTEGVLLEWRTESETNNIGFNVYRVDPLTQEQAKIGFVKGHGSTPIAHDYSLIDPSADEGRTYNYFIEDIDLSGNLERSRLISIDFITLADVIQIPGQFWLYQNFPNPFNPETWIPYDLAENANNVVVTIYNSLGAPIRTIEVGSKIAGSYKEKSEAIHWNGRNDMGEIVSNGLYFYRLSTDNYSSVKRMVILK